MGNTTTGETRGKQAPPQYFLVPNAVVPNLCPNTLDFAQTTGKPIMCAGWVAERGHASWSRENVQYCADVEIPVPQPHQVRVKLYAAGVNPADAQRTTALSQLRRTSTRSSPASRHCATSLEFPYVLGIEGAGVVESLGWDVDTNGDVGAGDSDLRVGDRVTFLTDFSKGTGGSFCQYALVDRDVVWKLQEVPSTVAPGDAGDLVAGRLIDFVEAATLPAAAATAYIALFDKLRVEPQRSIFISGASGGVGSVAVQLAHYFGLYVVASCSTRNVAYVEGLGADYVVDYARTDVVKDVLAHTDGCGVDYLLECASATMTEAHAEAVRFGGAVCVLTGLLVPCGDLVFRNQLSVHYVFLGMLHQDPLARQQLQPLGQLVLQLYAQGAFSVRVETVPFIQAVDALDVLASGHGRGKMVLDNFHMDEEQEERQRRKRVQLYEKAQLQLVRSAAHDPAPA